MYQFVVSVSSLAFFLLTVKVGSCLAKDGQPSELLNLGDSALTSEDTAAAIKYYEMGIASLTDKDSLVTALSLHTNLGTAFSSIGNNQQAVDAYREAISLHSASSGDAQKEASDVAAQAAFFLGMTHQELGNPEKAADAYAFANGLDPLHWSSLANLGSVLFDDLKQPAEALVAYNKAFEILTQTGVEATDAPYDPNYILSELQYRIGLAITSDPTRKCAVQDDPGTPVDCKELATHAYALATKYNPDHEQAKHMLAAITADATMNRASNTYVAALFDEYAHNFEHSLVDELKYNGYQRLRQGFDRAFGGSNNVPSFPLVVDAGCGTGLAGKEFRNVSEYLVGVDLSSEIIAEAKRVRPKLYDEIEVGDATDVFHERKPIDLIVAADSYIYFGDLVPLFRSMGEGLRNDGIVAFTLENVSEESEKSLQDAKPDWRWQLTPSGRFAHRKEYVEYVGQQHMLKTIRYENLDNFRYDNGVGVRGHLFVMQKQTNDEL